MKPPRRVEREMEEGDGNRDGDAPLAGPAGSAFGAAAPRHSGDAVFKSDHSASVRQAESSRNSPRAVQLIGLASARGEFREFP